MTKTPHVLIAGLFHESHSFVPGWTRLKGCEVLRGSESWRACGDLSPLGGVLEVARECDWEVAPAIDIRVVPGAPVEDEVVEAWKRAVEQTMEASEPFDGVFLVLHGAMQSQTCRDVEGEILAWLREKLGSKIPIGGVTDLHANFSDAMAQGSNALVTYRQNPHTDAKESAVRAARLFHRILQEELEARTVLLAPPLLLAPPATGTADEPMKTLEAMARAIETQHPEILTVNVHAGYAFADAPCTGLSFSAITTSDEASARELLQPLAQWAWSRRASTLASETPLESAMAQARALLKNGGPIILVEPSDNIGGGAPGDTTHILRALLRENRGGSNIRGGVVINDPHAVQALQDVPIGDESTLSVGGRSGPLSGGPVELQARLMSRSDGGFDLEDPHSHLASMYGQRIEMGPCALLESDGILVLLTSLKTPPFDLGQWRSQGVAPEGLDIIGVKAAVAHRQAYDPIAHESIRVSTPGACASDLAVFDFQHLRRPIFPLDVDAVFSEF